MLIAVKEGITFFRGGTIFEVDAIRPYEKEDGSFEERLQLPDDGMGRPLLIETKDVLVCDDNDLRGAEPGHERVVREAQQADADAEHAREHDSGNRDAQRVAHADRERAQVAVARRVVEQQLADVESGRVAQEVEARLDLPRFEVGGDVAREQDRKHDQKQGDRALQQPVAPQPRPPSGVPGGVGADLQRSGGAYIRPPLVQRLLTPRGSATGVFGPRLRSKLSP